LQPASLGPGIAVRDATPIAAQSPYYGPVLSVRASVDPLTLQKAITWGPARNQVMLAIVRKET
jgi:hypothetical protein